MAEQRLDSRISDLEDLYNAGREVRRIFEGQWLINMAYYLGQQWVKFDGLQLYQLAPGEERVTLTQNRIRGAVRTNIAKLTKSQPEWVGVPRDKSDEEIARARLRSVAFEHYWREQQMRRKLRAALWYRENCGRGFIKTTWDTNAGTAFTVMAQKGGPPVSDGYGRFYTPDRVRELPESVREGLEERRISLGDVNLSVRSPLELVVDPLATEDGLDTAEYLIEDSVYSKEAMIRLFGDAARDLEEDAQRAPGEMEARFPGLTEALRYGRDARGAKKRRGIRVREFWSPPGGYAGGKHVVWVPSQNRYFVEERNPYPWLPYGSFAGLPSGRFWCDGTVNDQISPQTELNKTTSQIAENAERFGNPARLRSRESIDLDSDWLGLPGEEIVYHDMGTQGSIPQFLVPPEMPAYVQSLPAQHVEALMAISNQREVAQGSVPEGVTAASAISQLIEQNDTMIGPDQGEISDGLVDVGKRLLWMLKNYATDERLLRIAGEDGAWDVYSFKGDELGAADADEVDIGTAASQSTAMKQSGIQWVLNTLIQNGQAPPPRELRRIFRDYEVGGLQHFFSSLGRDQDQCRDEHRRMILGEEVPINDFDNDELHVEEHDDFCKTSQFMELRRKPGGPATQQRILEHRAAHAKRLQDAATEQAMAQANQTALEQGSVGPGVGGPSSEPSQAPEGAPAPAPDSGPPQNGLPSAPSEPAAVGG